MFDVIRKLRPYFFSLREIDNHVSLDIKIPITWKYDDIIKPYSSLKFKIQDKNEKLCLISILSAPTQEGYDIAFTCALEIVVFNKEEEEKEKLLKEKIKELQELFKKQSLDNLKTINLLNDYGYETKTGDGVVEEGNGEGRETDRSAEEETD